MATRKKTAADEEPQAREAEVQPRRKPRPDPSAVNQSHAYDPAALYARPPGRGGTDASLEGVEGGAGGPGGMTPAAPDVVAGGTAAGAAGGTTTAGTV